MKVKNCNLLVLVFSRYHGFPGWSVTSNNMRVAPIESDHGKVSTTSRPASVMGRLRIEKVDDRYGMSIGGFYIAGNCNIILLVMACIFLVVGAIFTAISYRPRDPTEEMERYQERQASPVSSQVKIVGPISILIGLIMLVAGTVLGVIGWVMKKDERSRQYELSNGHEALQRVISQVITNYNLFF